MKGVRGRWAEAPIDSLVSALSSPATVARHLGDRLVQHLRAELANRKVPGTRQPAWRPRGPGSHSATASPSSLPPGSFCRRPSASRLPPSLQDRGFPHAVRSPDSVPDSCTLPPPGALAPGDPLPQPPFYLSRWPSFGFLICKVRTILSTTFTQHVTRRPKKRGFHDNIDY